MRRIERQGFLLARHKLEFLEHIRVNGGNSRSCIIRKMRTNYDTGRFALDELIEAGLLREEQVGRSKWVSLTLKGRGVLRTWCGLMERLGLRFDRV